MEQENQKKILGPPSLISLKNLKATKTTDFILPLFGYTKAFYAEYLVNAYLGDVDLNYFDEYKVYIVISNHRMQSQHMRIENTLKEMDEFIDYYDVLDGRMSVFVMNVPEEFKKDYESFLDGKYSQFSKEAKIKVLKGRSEKSAMPYIFNKSKNLKEYWETKMETEVPIGMEVWPILSIKQELFNKNNFLKN